MRWLASKEMLSYTIVGFEETYDCRTAETVTKVIFGLQEIRVIHRLDLFQFTPIITSPRGYSLSK